MRIRLTTTGRRSGEPRSVTLYAFDAGDEALVIVGSRGGAARDPAWALNLRAEPSATVGLAREERTVRAREVMPGDERERLWAIVCDAFPLYATYQRRTKRLIPLFLLDGRQGVGGGGQSTKSSGP
jgi:deazaflavin-dependent oxidoreductase (nitroreductase family)